MHLNVLKDDVGEWINSCFVATSNLIWTWHGVMDAVAEIDHEAFWSGCIKPSQWDYFFKVSQSFKNHFEWDHSRMRGKPSSWRTDAGWCSSRKVADKRRKGWLENAWAERSPRRKQKSVHLLHEPAMHCCSDGARVRAVTVFRVRPGDTTTRFQVTARFPLSGANVSGFFYSILLF